MSPSWSEMLTLFRKMQDLLCKNLEDVHELAELTLNVYLSMESKMSGFPQENKKCRLRTCRKCDRGIKFVWSGAVCVHVCMCAA